MIKLDGDGQTSPNPARQTNALFVDEILALFQGNSKFQVDDVLECVELMDWSSQDDKYGDAGKSALKEIMPSM